MTWEIEAQVEGGRVERGTVEASETASRDYLLNRFLARHIKNPGRREYWFYRNKQRAKIRPVDRLAELPDPQLDLDL